MSVKQCYLTFVWYWVSYSLILKLGTFILPIANWFRLDA